MSETENLVPDTVEIHGQEYVLIASRIAMFREDHPDWCIEPQILNDGDIVRCRTEIRDTEGRLIAVGHAEEDRTLGNINKTSSVENCETSSVGRALAFVSGRYAGKAVRSAEEMSDAVFQQQQKRMFQDWQLHTEKVEEHHDSLVAIREFLAEDNFDAAREAWNEVSNDDKQILWRATTKGGWFTPRERQQMKWWSNDFEVKK